MFKLPFICPLLFSIVAIILASGRSQYLALLDKVVLWLPFSPVWDLPPCHALFGADTSYLPFSHLRLSGVSSP